MRLASSWARPAILVAGKGKGGNVFISSVSTFIPDSLSSLSLSFIFTTISSIFFLLFSVRRHKMTQRFGMSLSLSQSVGLVAVLR